MIPRWLWSSDEIGYIRGWNPVRAEQHQAETERLLLGWAGPARVTGNRRDEAIILEREQRAAAMARRQLRRIR